MGEPSPTNEIRARIDALGEFDSVSPFSGLYYGVIAERLADDDRGTPDLYGAFLTHLDRELRYHRQLRNFAAQDSVEAFGVVSAADKRTVSLRDSAEALIDAEVFTDGQEATRCLLLAECQYHLGSFDRVVGNLEKAVALGGAHPLVHFALGYNRFMLAEQGFTATDADTGERVVIDPSNYRSVMLEAVSAFEDALTGGQRDPHLHWWIGMCLQKAGFEEAATDAFRQAEQDAGGPGVGAEPSRDAEDLPPISPGEIREVAHLLRRSYSAGDVLGREEPE